MRLDQPGLEMRKIAYEEMKIKHAFPIQDCLDCG